MVRHAFGLFLSAAMALASAQDKPLVKEFGPTPPRSVAYIGNSFFYFNNGIISHLSPMVAEGMKGHPYRSSMITISGSGFDWHDVDSYFRPNAVGKYSFAADNSVVFNTIDKLFEASVMMDCSQCPIHPTMKPIFHEYAKKHSDTVRKHGSQPVFFMSWAYADKPEMTEPLAAEYIKAGKAHNALVVPAGLAFAASVARRPDVSLIVADKRHPSLAGTYLAACTVLASVYKMNPVGNRYTAGLPADVAAHLQTVAWQTAQAFHTKEGRGSLR
ncbi:MAG: hypothetical protein FGM44_09585 [Limnohabitans sp.]|nr:hypothetical protein [Limnohabitans sp.]